MNRSKVTVQRTGQGPSSGRKVVLGFSGLLGGMTHAVYTDRNGVAIIEHASTGEVTVYVDGSRKGTFRAPGETVVFL